MKQVVKLVIIDKDGSYLLLYRGNHPVFGNDPDLPGGKVEAGETVLQALGREVQEEISVSIDKAKTEEVYSGTGYSAKGTQYSLFITRTEDKPKIIMSWEHSSYEWLEREIFLNKAKNANDIYMHMVYDVLK